MRGVERRGVGERGLGHAAQVLDGGDARPRGGHRVHQAEVAGDPQVEGVRLVEHRLEQGRVDPGVDLDQVHAGVDQAVHRLAGVARAVGAEGVGIGRRQAVDHRARAVDPRPADGAGVDLLAQVQDGVELAVEVAHRGDAPGEISGKRPALDVGVRVDQSRDDPAAGARPPRRAWRAA